MDKAQDIWHRTLSTLESEVSKTSFETWFKPLSLVAVEKDCLILSVVMEFTKNIIESRYSSLLVNAVSEAAGRPFTVSIITKEEALKYKAVSTGKTNPASPNCNLNPKYTFDTFVVGESNRFANAASLAVAEAPAQAYNPLFLYGGAGLGKTHLMHAIGNFITSVNPQSKVLYISSENFTNELINSIKDNKNEEFRNKYRMVDVLMVDDIQFIGGKEKTEEEFFHTFNQLYQGEKQIILTSDRPPKEIHTLEERLRSRFEWGLICDVQPPDYETRVAILRKKSQSEKANVNDSVLEYVAGKIDSNIRELEGALTRITAYCKLERKEMNTELAAEVLKEIFSGQRNKTLSIAFIQKKVAEYYDINTGDIISQKRNKEIVAARQMAMYICRTMLDCSLPKIGQEFGGRDHTTVIHSIKRVESDKKRNSSLNSTINAIMRSIQE